MLPNIYAKQEKTEYRCAALCKNKPTTLVDIRITDIDPTSGQHTGEWSTVAYCTRHWNEIRERIQYRQVDDIIRGYTESKWGNVIQIVEYSASWPIV